MGGSSSKDDRGKKPKASAVISSKDKAVLDLKNARDRVKKYQKKVEKERETLHHQAMALLKAGKRDRAKLTLRLKKHKELQLEKADGQLLTVLEMVESVEWESQQAQVFEGLKAGNAILNEIHQELTVDAVESLMEETAEAQDVANEISRAIGGTLSEADDESVLAELAEIEQMEADQIQLDLPKAPTDTIATANAVDTTKTTTAAVEAKPKAAAKVAEEPILS